MTTTIEYEMMKDFSEMWKHYVEKDEFEVASAFVLCEDYVNNVSNGSPITEWLPKVRSSILKAMSRPEIADSPERDGFVEALEIVDMYASTYGVEFVKN